MSELSFLLLSRQSFKRQSLPQERTVFGNNSHFSSCLAGLSTSQFP